MRIVLSCFYRALAATIGPVYIAEPLKLFSSSPYLPFKTPLRSTCQWTAPFALGPEGKDRYRVRRIAVFHGPGGADHETNGCPFVVVVSGRMQHRPGGRSAGSVLPRTDCWGNHAALWGSEQSLSWRFGSAAWTGRGRLRSAAHTACRKSVFTGNLGSEHAAAVLSEHRCPGARDDTHSITDRAARADQRCLPWHWTLSQNPSSNRVC